MASSHSVHGFVAAVVRAPLLPLLLLLPLLAACPKKQCAGASDCASGQVCSNKACGSCSNDGECRDSYGGSFACVGGSCTESTCSPGATGCSCTADGGCAGGRCQAGTCTACERGAAACPCFDNRTCDPGLRCVGDAGCQACTPGAAGCPCRAGNTCDTSLVCDQNVCVTESCPRTTQGCACGDGGACAANLYCAGNNTCATCSTDVVGCPCAAGACTNDLVCDGASQRCRAMRTCAQSACAAHQDCTEGAAGADATCQPSCTAGFRWNAANSVCDELDCETAGPTSVLADCTGQNRRCTATAGAGARCDTCLAGFSDEGGTLTTCRALRTCTDLGCAAAFRGCSSPTAVADAACTACIAGYTDVSGTCTLNTCTPGVPGSIAASCASQHRACDQPASGGATCGGCVATYGQNTRGECQLPHACGALDLDCAASGRRCEGVVPLQYCGTCLDGTTPDPADASRCIAPKSCLELECGADFCVEGAAGQVATCVAARCGTNQAYNAYTSACDTCVVSCNTSVTGETGRIWPYTLDNGHCICETVAGNYWDEGDRRPKPCDADGDGWVRDSARSAYESTDPAMRDNARCRVRTVDRFVLENELGQRLPVFLCATSPTLTSDRRSCTTAAPLRLYEPVRNDDQVQLDADSVGAPAYTSGTGPATVGRRFRAAEVNGLTRACVSEGADYNGNGIADLREWHGMQGSLAGDKIVLAQFAHFIELHRGWYEAGTESVQFGQYVVQERPRCDSAFPLGYGTSGSGYWRECTRSRDVAYNGTDGQNYPDFGLDFARWSCVSETGSCPVPPPPTDEPASGAIPEHGLCRQPPVPLSEEECQAAGPWPCVGGQVWRGMSHHSQFRCVLVRQDPGTDTPTLAESAFNGGAYVLNDCRVNCPDSDKACAADCAGTSCATSTEPPVAGRDATNPRSAKVKCSVDATATNGEVGFAAVAYLPVSGVLAYQRGCINEWSPSTPGNPLAPTSEVTPWRALCPGWTADPRGTLGGGNLSEFGRLGCGCDYNYGGPNCDVGCPDGQLNYSPGYVPTPRSGYWMCADFTSVGYDTLDAVHGSALFGTDTAGAMYEIGDVIGLPSDGQPLCETAGCTTGWAVR